VTMLQSYKSSRGFTLIELMIVVVIVGVLALVAYPAYQSSVIKANRAEAKSYLLDVAQKQQLFFNDSRTYAESALELNSTAPERVEENYTVTFEISTVVPPPIFTITATPIDGTRQEGDGFLSINNSGGKSHNGEAW
jgi:type IV pilus assembly protein PilE